MTDSVDQATSPSTTDTLAEPHDPRAEQQAEHSDVTSLESQPSESGSETALPEGAGAVRIKIGSQRDSTRPRVTPAPLQGSLPSTLQAERSTSASDATSEAQPVAPPAAEEPDHASPVESNRPSRLAAQVSSELESRRERVEVPSLRRDLSPDLQDELDAAMGGQSVDALLDSTDKAAPLIELAAEARVRGRVVSIHHDNIFVDLGQPVQGVVSLRQFAEPPEIGAEVEVMVIRFDGEEGLYELTLPGGAVDVGDWSQVSEGMVVEARVTAVNKGGVECEVNQLRGFIPASQVSLYRVEDLSSLIGEKFLCVVNEVKIEKRNLVLSRRAYLERERESSRQQLLAELAPGQIREGVVHNLQPFGAFVDLGGIDGLVHVSEISWQRVNHPNEVLTIGQTVKVRVKKVDPESGKISLGMKELSESPWDHVATQYPAKSSVTGVVTKIMEFGAFVELEPGVEGLIHISELDHKRVFRATDVVQVDQEVTAQILSVDVPNRRISLSLKALKARAMPTPQREETEETTTPAAKRPVDPSLKGGRGSTSGGERFGLKW